MDCETCPYAEKMSHILSDIENEKKHSSEVRKEIYDRLRELEKERVRTDERYKNISKDLEELKSQQSAILNEIKELTNKPAKRWDTALSGLIGSVIGAIVAFVSQKLFGG